MHWALYKKNIRFRFGLHIFITTTLSNYLFDWYSKITFTFITNCTAHRFNCRLIPNPKLRSVSHFSTLQLTTFRTWHGQLFLLLLMLRWCLFFWQGTEKNYRASTISSEPKKNVSFAYERSHFRTHFFNGGKDDNDIRLSISASFICSCYQSREHVLRSSSSSRWKRLK